MSEWSNPKQIRQTLLKRWQRGDFLRAAIDPEAAPLFPFCLSLKRPGRRELVDRFAEAQQWVQRLQQGERPDQSGYRIEWESLNHRQLGHNRIPLKVCFTHPEPLLRYIGKQQDYTRFIDLNEQVTARYPQLQPWVIRHPHRLLQYRDEWEHLLTIVEWVETHPCCGRYLRQIDLPGIDTKYIEQHRRLLSELLDLVLPTEAIDPHFSGTRGFESRYGFLGKPVMIQFRILDPSSQPCGLSHLALPLEAFAQLQLKVDTIFITENEINGLAFPQHPGSLVIFGLGYGLQPLQQIPWLRSCTIHYWGDIDSHGFAMLDQIRHYLPQTQSILMNRETLLQHQPFWGVEQKPTTRELARLTAEEQSLYQELLNHTHAQNLRLEQERIHFSALQQVLTSLI